MTACNVCEYPSARINAHGTCTECGSSHGERERVRYEVWERDVTVSRAPLRNCRGECGWFPEHHGETLTWAATHPTREGAIALLWERCEAKRLHGDAVRAIGQFIAGLEVPKLDVLKRELDRLLSGTDMELRCVRPVQGFDAVDVEVSDGDCTRVQRVSMHTISRAEPRILAELLVDRLRP